MRTLLTSLIIIFFVAQVQAKLVKFAVNMTTQTISVNGLHLISDFQAAIGKGPDWDPSTLLLTKEGQTSIYSVVVNIPAFKKYEYRFVNGDQTYEAEFVPDESRVGYDGVDNRWIYVDSLSKDTSFVGAIIFGGNAPLGKLLVRYKVDLSSAGASTLGIHVGTSYQSSSFNPAVTRLYSFGSSIYEIIDYAAAGSYSYLYYNGNSAGSSETVPAPCVLNGKRSLPLLHDTLLPVVCLSSCDAVCKGVGINSYQLSASNVKVYPNPASDQVSISFDQSGSFHLSLIDNYGKVVLSSKNTQSGDVIGLESLSAGIYIVQIANGKSKSYSKIVIAK